MYLDYRLHGGAMIGDRDYVLVGGLYVGWGLAGGVWSGAWLAVCVWTGAWLEVCVWTGTWLAVCVDWWLAGSVCVWTGVWLAVCVWLVVCGLRCVVDRESVVEGKLLGDILMVSLRLLA